MRTTAVIIIIALLVLGFGWLTYYAARHSRGEPVAVAAPERFSLNVPFIDQTIDVTNGLSATVWDSLAVQKFDLIYQLMALPWPQKLVPAVEVKAFHNRRAIYYLLQWTDDSVDQMIAPGKFADACAIMFPLGDEVKSASLMMGFLGKSNIWQWKASQDQAYWTRSTPEAEAAYSDYTYPFEAQETLPVSLQTPVSAVNNLISIRIGTITLKSNQDVHGRGLWTNGQWRVMFSRAFNAQDADTEAAFAPGTEKFCAFAVWNGAAGDRGGRKSISSMIHLNIN
ncbi:MAG: hypothetical protein HYV35_01135 [Lentisphaerae bacterium]|nr:hypothetical protein [Lentisphaerota bacterium]